MPNGGSDTCSRCIYNLGARYHLLYQLNANIADALSKLPLILQADWADDNWVEDVVHDYCTLRACEVDKHWHCANHMKHNYVQTPIPIGPIMQSFDVGFHESSRMAVTESLDTPTIRNELLRLLRCIEHRSTDEYPIGPAFDETVILELSTLKEARAIPDLQRIAQAWFDSNESQQVSGTRIDLVGAAVRGLSQFFGDALLPKIDILLALPTSENTWESPRNLDNINLKRAALVALHYCSETVARPRLEAAIDDASRDIRRFAIDLLSEANRAAGKRT